MWEQIPAHSAFSDTSHSELPFQQDARTLLSYLLYRLPYCHVMYLVIYVSCTRFQIFKVEDFALSL